MKKIVTFEEIVNAAELITAKGDNPTIEKIRISIGSRGSNSTISKHLNNWRKNIPIHKECYLNHAKPVNENGNSLNKFNNVENINIKNQLDLLKEQYCKAQHELINAKNKLFSLYKYQEAWQKEKDQYITDLKQAHKISLEVLNENYNNNINKLETKLNLLQDKIEKYITNSIFFKT